MSEIRGRRVLVTGASRGMGLLMAERMARMGAHVILWSNELPLVGAAADRIKRGGGSAEWKYLDVSDRDAVRDAAAELQARGGPIDILVNNAGIVRGKPLLDLSDDDILRTFAVNALAHFWTVRAFLPAMLARDSGHVVTIASAAGICAVPRLADYSATKFAAFGFDEALRLELERRGSHVKTTVVCPYYVDTGMFAGARTRFSWLLPILRPEYVVDRVVHAVEHDRRQLVLPRIVRVTWLARLLPVAWFDAIARWLGIDRSMDEFVGHGTRPALPPVREETAHEIRT